MDPIPNEIFFRWAEGAGVGFDPRYPNSQCLSLLPPRAHNRFWDLPRNPDRWPDFAATLLEGLDAWQVGYLWPRGGNWPQAAGSSLWGESVRDVILRGAGIPDGWLGAIRCGRSEEDRLVAVLYAYLVFGWCAEDDLFFVPDHGQQLLRTDHHDVVHVQCSSEERIQELVEYIAQQGYELPAGLPDATFKRPDWMPDEPN